MTTISFKDLLQEAKSVSHEALPLGDYDVEIETADAVTSSTGKPMIKVKARVINGPHERRPVLTQFVLSMENSTAVSIFFRNMRSFGLDEAFFASLGMVGDLTPVASALVGRRARWTLGHREWQGETRNEVTAIKPYTGAPGPQASVPTTGVPGPVAPTGGASPSSVPSSAPPVLPAPATSGDAPTPPAPPELPF